MWVAVATTRPARAVRALGELTVAPKLVRMWGRPIRGPTLEAPTPEAPTREPPMRSLTLGPKMHPVRTLPCSRRVRRTRAFASITSRADSVKAGSGRKRRAERGRGV